MSRLIDADELELDAEWDDYYDGFTAYSKRQIEDATAVEAISRENIDKMIAEIDGMLSDGMVHKKTVLAIIHKYTDKEQNE